MTSKFSKHIALLLTFITLLSLSEKVQAQDGGINGGIKKVTDKFNEGVDRLFNGKKNKKDKAGGTNSKKNSDIKESDFFQVNTIPNLDPNNTRLKIAKNLMIDVKGKYPFGYNASWRFVSYNSPLDFQVENWIAPNSGLQSDRKNISIGEYEGKAVLRFGAFITCDCFADIVINEGGSILSDKPQTFKLTNFRKIINERTSGEPCIGIGNNIYTDGGWEGKITLSANSNADITMDLMLENYTVGYQPSFQKEYLHSTVSYRYFVKNITVANEMSAEKANEIVEAEKAAKQRQKDYVIKTTKQAEILEKSIAKKYTQKSCIDCFFSSRGSYISSSSVDYYYVESGNYAETKTSYDYNTVTVIKNKCSYPLTFIGIQQMYDETNGYYLKEVTKTMPVDYNYSADQGLASSLFTKFIGGGSEFNFSIQDKFYVDYASVGSVQWLKVIRK